MRDILQVAPLSMIHSWWEEAIRRDSLDEISSPSSTMMWTSVGAPVGIAIVEGVGIDSVFGLSSKDFLGKSLRT